MMDLSTLQWDESICSEMKIPLAMLPEIKPSVTTFGHVRGRGTLAGVAISGILGDQQSACSGKHASNLAMQRTLMELGYSCYEHRAITQKERTRTYHDRVLSD